MILMINKMQFFCVQVIMLDDYNFKVEKIENYPNLILS